jgi:hypothetical protein
MINDIFLIPESSLFLIVLADGFVEEIENFG